MTPEIGLFSESRPCSSWTSWGEAFARELVAAERPHRGGVGAGGAAEAEVDAAGVERLQRPELLGDHQRRVVWQHDAAGAEADLLRVGADVGDQDRGRRAGDRADVVVLGVPDAPVAEPLRNLGEADRAGEAVGDVLGRPDRGEVEDREGDVGAPRRV